MPPCTLVNGRLAALSSASARAGLGLSSRPAGKLMPVNAPRTSSIDDPRLARGAFKDEHDNVEARLAIAGLAGARPYSRSARRSCDPARQPPPPLSVPPGAGRLRRPLVPGLPGHPS